MSEQRFPYGTQRGVLIGALLFFGGCGALLVHLAISGREVRLFPLPVTTSGGPVFVMGALSFAFVAVGVAQLVTNHRLGPRELVVAPSFLEAPKSPWKRATVKVRRGAIRDVKLTDVMGTQVIEIAFDGGKLALSNRTVGDAGLAAVRDWLERAAH